MGTLKINFLFFALLLLTITNNLSAQSIEEKERINEYSVQANKLIWHLNLNMKNLRNYQIKLNEWYLSTNTTTNAPKFVFSPNINEGNVGILLADKSIQPSNLSFNYQKALSDLNKQVSLFNKLCTQLPKISKAEGKKEFYKQNMIILYQIDGMADELVNLCYNFSLSCAINYGKETIPIELEHLKSTVGQAKNVIMAIRDNNKIQVKSYLNQLNNSITTSYKDTDYSNLKRLGRFYLSEIELKEKQHQILDAANQIAFWGEQYLQSNFELEEILPILENSIIAFNVFEGEAGCSASYNELVANSKNQYLFFTEEPLFFEVKEQDLLIESKEVENIKIPTIASTPIKTKDTVIVPKPVVKAPIVEEFNKDDINTLQGALPNNIIIMMDVSASMKLTGKLPLLKSSIVHLLNIMRPEDRISLIAYSGESEILIAGASIKNKAEVKTILDTLHSSGGTDIENGVKLAYQTAKASLMKNGNNRILIATDGEFGVRTPLLKIVQENTLSGIYLSILQFDDSSKTPRNASLKLLAETGKGNYRTILNSQDALNELMLEVKQKGGFIKLIINKNCEI